VFSQLRDGTSRYKSEAELSKPTASSKQQQAAALATTTLSESKQMGLDTVTISIATKEESTGGLGHCGKGWCGQRSSL
jgi:hypothetical protein